ncbi:MAG TPA: winged helix DNA-binding domain-containing protein [Actinomycetota bacterium]|nr:winged helix DNA-binding domain-containing protein [Actinomycetota bacterium]
MERLTWDEVRAWRVARQYLSKRAQRRRLQTVVSEICGVHAQVSSAAELQLWARVEGIRPEHVREALWTKRTLARTWSMRGTLHLLTAEDLPMYVAALRTHDRWWKGAWLKFVGLTETQLRELLDAIHESLGARPLTRVELAENVAKRVGASAKERMLSNWGEMLKPAAFHGWLMSGPPRGQNVTFVRPDKWLGEWKEWDPSDAWREIVRRYLRAYGPATREEFARWWGMQPAPAGRILEASGDELQVVDVEGDRAWALKSVIPEIQKRSPKPPVRLLPAFDVYVAGSRPKESLVEKRFEPRVFRQAGWISPVVLTDGKVAGVWNHERAAARSDVSVDLFRRLSAAQKKEIAEEGDRLGSFLGAPAVVSYSGV